LIFAYTQTDANYNLSFDLYCNTSKTYMFIEIYRILDKIYYLLEYYNAKNTILPRMLDL